MGVTIGVDVGTTSVKAVAADDEGRVVARTRIPHGVLTPTPGALEHDARQAWRDDVRAAAAAVAAEVRAGGDRVEAVQVAAMVPSLCPIDDSGVPIGPGLLYGDERAKGGTPGLDPSSDGELGRMLAWLVGEHPDAAGYWPAQAVANAALCGEGVIDGVTAVTASPLFDSGGWSAQRCAEAGAAPDQLPAVRTGTDPAGTALADLGPDLAGAVVGAGTIDAFAEQLVAGADAEGDVLVILGATLITWAVVGDWREVPGLWTVPHTAAGLTLVGGPSNAGGLLVDWARRVLQPEGATEAADAASTATLGPDDVPVVLPYLRGERTPLHDRDRRGEVHGLSLAHGPATLWRAVREATGHSVRHHLELAGALEGTTRIVATGGGVRDRAWVQAIADVIGVPVDVVATPEGGALGAAWLARVAAGMEADPSASGRWARTAERVEPDIAWVGPCAARHRRFVELTGAPR